MPSRFPLALLPTPLVDATRLSQFLGGPRILLKRDDLTGFGAGGNKVRGLEYLMAEALGEKADVIVTGAGPQSNHVRATAAAARVAGLEVVAVMHGERPAETQGNLFLDELLDAQIRFTHNPDRATVDEKIEEVAAELRRSGRRPYVIPRGGASPLGALGYLRCVREMGEQLRALHAEPQWIAVATGSCGTQSGLLAGTKISAAPHRILGISVSRPATECEERINRFATQAARLAGHTISLSAGDVVVREGFIGPGYGVPSPEGIHAIRLLARTEGLFLDPTYTSKAMAGLIAEIDSGRITKKDTVVFVHTGGEPALFAHPEVLC
jgi:D-cysteine desulfhydrase family pyridoxal phosphate-dependent enzyme